MRHMILCFLWLLGPVWVWAQPAPLPLPKVSKELLAEKSYTFFPDAEAIIIQDYGDLNFFVLGGKMKLHYRYLRQVKILKESGTRWAEIRIPYLESEKVVEILAYTYTLAEHDGKVVKVKLDKEEITDQALGEGEYVKILRIPKPRPGAVIAYRYSIQTEDYGRLRPWQFQYEIPVAYSQYITRIPSEFSYLAIFQGENHNLDRKSTSLPQTQRYRFVERMGDFPRVFPKNQSVGVAFMPEESYSMTNVPAFKEEPLMGSPNNYISRIRFQLSEVEGLEDGKGKIVQTWKDLNDRLLIHPQFGRQLTKYTQWEKAVSEMLTSRPEERLRMEAIYEKLREQIRWNGIYGIFVVKDLPEVYAQKTGNSAEVNLLLTAILQAEGFKAYPVLVSTREHGQVNELFPILEQFNHVITEVDFKGERIYMDATQAFIPMGMLPFNVINGQGFRIGEKKATWLPLRPRHEKHRRTYARFVMDDQGHLTGKIRHLDKGYSAARTRALLAGYDQQVEDFFRDEIIAEFSDAELGEFDITDQYLIGEPVSTKAEFKTSDFVTITDDVILLSPLLSEGYEENPFGMGERNYPVDFGVPIVEQYLLVLTLPDGYSFDVVPEDIHVVLPRDGGKFSYQTLIIQGKHIQILSKIEINKTFFSPEEYSAIRSFFDHIAAKHNEKLIIKRGKGN